MVRQRHYVNSSEVGGDVFVATTVLDFAPIFSDRAPAEVGIATLARVCREQGAKLHAFVFMPEDVHFVATLPAGEKLSIFVGRLKSLIAREIAPNLTLEQQYKLSQQIGLNRRTIWQRSFKGLHLRSDQVFWQKVSYIHANPVRRGLCLAPEDFAYSSARLYLAGEHRGIEEGLPLWSTSLLGSGPRYPNPPPQGAEA